MFKSIAIKKQNKKGGVMFNKTENSALPTKMKIQRIERMSIFSKILTFKH